MSELSSKLGRRPGKSNTKESIRKSATKLFATRGYERTTIRMIAEATKVDPGLVIHHFGSKEELLLACVKTPRVPVEAVGVFNLVPQEKWGLAMAKIVLGLMNSRGQSNQIIAMVRAAADEPKAARMLRKMYEEEMLVRIKAAGIDNPEIRAGMLSSLAMGLVFMSNVVGYEGFKAAPKFQQTQILANSIQTILTTKLA